MNDALRQGYFVGFGTPSFDYFVASGFLIALIDVASLLIQV